MTHTDHGVKASPPRQIGPIGTGARVVLGATLLALAILSTPTMWEVLGGLVLPNVVVAAIVALRGRRAPPLRLLGPGANAANCVTIVLFFLVAPVAADLFYGSTLLAAAAQGQPGCEVSAVSNWLWRRNDKIGCPVLTPIDALDGPRRSRPPMSSA